MGTVTTTALLQRTAGCKQWRRQHSCVSKASKKPSAEVQTSAALLQPARGRLHCSVHSDTMIDHSGSEGIAARRVEPGTSMAMPKNAGVVAPVAMTE